METGDVLETEPEALERQYRALLQAAPDPIFVADVETGHIIEANEAAEELRDEPREEIVGIHQSELHPPEDAERYKELFRNHVEDGGTKQYLPDGSQIYAVTGDGEKVPVEINVTTVELPERDVIYGVFRDISDRVTRQKALRETKNFNQELVENAPIALVRLDSEFRIQYENPHAESIIGVPEDTEESAAIGTDIRELPSIVEAGIGHTFDRLREGERVSLEFDFTSIYGKESYLRGRGVPLFHDGEFDGAIIMLQDITERQEKSRELETQRRRYRSLFENNPLVIWEEDFSEAKGALDELADSVDDLESYLRSNPEDVRRVLQEVEVIDVNRNALEYYGATCKDELLERFEELFTREALDKLVGELVAVAEGRRRFRTETVSRTLDGDRKDEILEFYVPESSAEDYSRVYVTTMDITEEKERRRELRTFEKAVEAAGHSIYVTDRDGRIEYVNPAFEATTGYTAAEAIGRNPRILKSGEHGQEFYKRLWEAILSGETWRSEITNRTKSGERYVADQTIAPVMDEEDRIVRFVSVNSDITDRKRREEMLEAERDRAMDLQQRLSVVNRIMRHDLRSAVNIIKGNADLAESVEGEPTEMLATIKRQAEKLHRISENARLIEETLESGESHRTTQDLAETVSTKLAKLRNAEPGVSINSEMPNEAPVKAHTRLGTAVENLLQNAVEHNDAEAPQVTVDVEQADDSDDRIELAIADNGPGIPEDEIEPLQEGVEEALTHTSGLGLWIVYWIVERSNGEITFDENAPRGTIVRLRLPRAG